MSTSPSMHSTDEEKTVQHEVDKNDVSPFSPAPDGGFQAWMVVVGGFFTYFATFDK